jgi:hypothetical protein
MRQIAPSIAIPTGEGYIFLPVDCMGHWFSFPAPWVLKLLVIGRVCECVTVACVGCAFILWTQLGKLGGLAMRKARDE